jgi:hypothetical protein
MTAIAGGGMTEQQREQREAATSADLLEHPGFLAILKDAVKEARAARGIILYGGDAENVEQYVTKVERARGSLAVLKNLVLAVYRRANKEVPDNVKSQFE